MDNTGKVAKLPAPQLHWLWVSDPLMRRLALVDLDSGRFLGILDSGYGIPAALFDEKRHEIDIPDTYYSRGSRGKRTDVLSIYDGSSLAPAGEVVLPPKRAMNTLPNGNATLTDDDRFAVVWNETPASSVTVVDLEDRRVASEIQTAGCSLVYAAGPHRFAMLCMDGSLLMVGLDAQGKLLSRTRSKPFFDPVADPVTEKAVRIGETWLFVSFDGIVHPVDFSGPEPHFEKPWSLVDQEDREARWRIGGSQLMAAHAGLGRIYVLMHQGGVDTHKAPGREVWVYDVSSHKRLARIKMQSPGYTYLGTPIEFGKSWVWPFDRISDWLLDVLPGPGIDAIQVTQDAHPLLVAASTFSGGLAVYDAKSGEFLRRVYSGNLTNAVLQVPFAAGSGKP